MLFRAVRNALSPVPKPTSKILSGFSFAGVEPFLMKINSIPVLPRERNGNVHSVQEQI